MKLQLVPIERPGTPADTGLQLPDIALEVCADTASLYESAGFVPPWLGYLALSEGRVVGSCGFKSPPVSGEVEIAYFTFPGFEGRGIASAMARELMALAVASAPGITVTAQTLRERGASSRILEKLGFRLRGDVTHPEDGEVWEWEYESRRGSTSMNVSVRPERPGDAPEIREVNELAFGGPQEAQLVDALRGTDEALSFVATVDDRVVGHILFTPVQIEPPPGDLRVAGLAPMAVRPECQRSGVGGRLIRAGLEECRRRGYGAVVVVGHPEYYPRFGFVPAHTRGLDYEAPVPREAFMVLELEADALAGRAGVVRYRSEFSASD